MHDHEPGEECAICAAGGPTPEVLRAYRAKALELIKEHGQFVQLVKGDRESLPFMYTIGNSLLGLPELLLVGFSSPKFHHVLNVLGEKLREQKRPFVSGELVDIDWTFSFKIITTRHDAQEEYTIQVKNILGHEPYVVQQVVLCDKNGKFPGEPGCEEPFASLPVLYQN